MKKRFENWVNFGTSAAVILGIIFLGMEINQNTEMMKSQARDSITEKQMMFSEWVATEPEMAIAITAASESLESMQPEQRTMYSYFLTGVWREWENSYYQFERGLFDAEEFEPRMVRWQSQMETRAARAYWAGTRLWYAPGFRAVVDGYVQAIESRESGNATNR